MMIINQHTQSHDYNSFIGIGRTGCHLDLASTVLLLYCIHPYRQSYELDQTGHLDIDSYEHHTRTT